MTKSVTPELVQYIESTVLPRYEAFDKAHHIDHARTVIARSVALAQYYDVDIDMVYAIAAYHDTGLVLGRENHHIVSGRILESDTSLRQWFSHADIEIMRDAVEDHRASSGHEPRTVYGLIVAEADRCINVETIIRRTVQYGLEHYPELDREQQYERCMAHLTKKYGDNGYLHLWIPESENATQLEALRKIIRDPRRTKELFDEIFSAETNHVVPQMVVSEI